MGQQQSSVKPEQCQSCLETLKSVGILEKTVTSYILTEAEKKTLQKNFLRWTLKNHPDKVRSELRDEATKNFQTVSNCVDIIAKENKCDNQNYGFVQQQQQQYGFDNNKYKVLPESDFEDETKNIFENKVKKEDYIKLDIGDVIYAHTKQGKIKGIIKTKSLFLYQVEIINYYGIRFGGPIVQIFIENIKELWNLTKKEYYKTLPEEDYYKVKDEYPNSKVPKEEYKNMNVDDIIQFTINNEFKDKFRGRIVYKEIFQNTVFYKIFIKVIYNNYDRLINSDLNLTNEHFTDLWNLSTVYDEPRSEPRSEPKGKCENVICKNTQICNPVSGRCVLKTGKIGQEILGDSRSKPKSKKSSKSSKKSSKSSKKSSSKSKSSKYESWKVPELKDEMKKRKISGYSRLTKNELIKELIKDDKR